MENNKIKITRSYKNENEPQHIFFIHFFLFFFSLLVHFFFFLNFCFLYSHFFSFFLSFLFSFLLYSFLFFPFQQVTRKWNDKNKGTFINKVQICYTCLKPTPKTVPRPLFSLKFMTTWFSTFWLVMSYKVKEGVKSSKKVTMDINAR